ncbi:MAG: hypothetical protein ABUL60_05440 [Myxococcales bacterium]
MPAVPDADVPAESTAPADAPPLPPVPWPAAAKGAPLLDPQPAALTMTLAASSALDQQDGGVRLIGFRPGPSSSS